MKKMNIRKLLLRSYKGREKKVLARAIYGHKPRRWRHKKAQLTAFNRNPRGFWA